jgi:NADH-quinone oxidoreductase subunit M
MMLVCLFLIPLAAGLLAWRSARYGPSMPRWICLAATALDLVLLVLLWWRHGIPMALAGNGPWILEVKAPWIPQLGVTFHLAMDGLSLLMLLLTAVIGLLSVAASWTEIQDRVGFFHFNLMWILAGIIGVFLAMDLFLFYFFWEMMLIPMYFLIAIWGHENRVYAAIKFFLFTQISGLLMLVAILGLYFVHGNATGLYTFDYMDLLGTAIPASTARWLMLGFLIAFVVKLPAVPVHSWLPDAHTEAPTAGSVILAGLLLKTGAYGLIRFVVPLFPEAALSFAPTAMLLGVIGIVYGAVLAFAQTDLKRLVAYTSVSHMGFVLLGVFAWNIYALQGAVMQMICHGLATGSLFILVGILKERIHTRDMRLMGGLWSAAPRMGAVALFFAIASLGLPGLGNFVAEFLVLTGTYYVSVWLTAVAALGLVLASVYSLWIIFAVFHGPNKLEWKFPDLSLRESAILGAAVLGLVWLGLFPKPVIDTAGPALNHMRQVVDTAARPEIAWDAPRPHSGTGKRGGPP